VNVKDIDIRFGQLVRGSPGRADDRTPDEPEERAPIRRKMPDPNTLPLDRLPDSALRGPAHQPSLMSASGEPGSLLP